MIIWHQNSILVHHAAALLPVVAASRLRHPATADVGPVPLLGTADARFYVIQTLSAVSCGVNKLA